MKISGRKVLVTGADGFIGSHLTEHLLEAGADVKAAAAASGWTPLHIASAHCNEALVRLLVASGANPQARDKRGKTPLPCYAFAHKPARDARTHVASCR